MQLRNRGCLETVTSDQAVLRDIAARGGPDYRDISQAIEQARSGADQAAAAAFEAMGSELGRGLATVCNLLNPERIVLTGERASAYDLFGAACERSWRSAAFSTAAADCELVVDNADDTVWARGAACLVIREAVGGYASSARAVNGAGAGSAARAGTETGHRVGTAPHNAKESAP